VKYKECGTIMETADNKKRRGRPPKKDYDEEKQFKALMHEVDYCFDITGEIKATAIELNMNPIRVKKLLITSGKLEYEETKQIQRLLAYGRSLLEIQSEMNLKKSSINSYLPYSKLPYKEDEISANADRCDLYRKRKAAVESINDKDSLRECVDLFSHYRFMTPKGKAFRYYCECEEKLIVIEEDKTVISFDDIADSYFDKISEYEETPDNHKRREYIESIIKRFGRKSNDKI